MKPSTLRRLVAAIAAAGLALVALAPAGTAATSTPKPVKTLKKLPTAKVVRIGFFGNVTHATALVAQDKAFFEKFLAPEGTTIQYTLFNAGPAEIEALKGGSIDVGFVGPSPAVSGYASTHGDVLRIVAGTTGGGAQFITKSDITTVADLRGKNFATPQLGNTQDVALRAYLKKQGYTTSVLGGGDVTITPTSNATTLTQFTQGNIDGAWVPEPWASRLVLEANGHVFLDEKSLWPKGKFTTTVLFSGTNFLKQYPGTVRSLIRAEIFTNKWISTHKQAAKDSIQNQLQKWTGAKLSDAVINRAFANIYTTVNPNAAAISTSVDDAVDAGLLTNIGSKGIANLFDLRLLNSLQKFYGLPTYSAAGFGKQ